MQLNFINICYISLSFFYILTVSIDLASALHIHYSKIILAISTIYPLLYPFPNPLCSVILALLLLLLHRFVSWQQSGQRFALGAWPERANANVNDLSENVKRGF